MSVSNLIGQKLGCCHLTGLIYIHQICHFKTVISKLIVGHYVLNSKMVLPYQELYVGCHYFRGIYHLLPFGSFELHVFVHRFYIQAFCFEHQLYIVLCFISIKAAFSFIPVLIFMPPFSFIPIFISFLYSVSCLSLSFV